MYSGISDPTRWVLPRVLEEQGQARPDAPWIITTEGDRLTFGQAATDARRAAGYFRELGVRPGDFIGVMLPNSCNFVRVWQGLETLGAVAILLNTELRGPFLRHQLQNSGVELVVVDETLRAVVEAVAADVPGLRRLVVVGGQASESTAGLARLDWDAWQSAEPYRGELPRPEDIACVMYTSGTSGSAKGVLMPHAHCTLFGVSTVDATRLRDDDCYYTVLPLFHANGMLQQLAATLLVGIPAVLRPRFSATSWLDDIRTHGATVTNTLGVLAAFVVAQPPTERDRDHRLRAMLLAPFVPELSDTFRRRFGVREILSGFGMTEANICVLGSVADGAGPAAPVYDKYFEVIIADPDTDAPVPAGQLGEILVRPKLPFGFMAGYHAMPEKTVEAWRNLWFHTGDAGTQDADGRVAFIDRIKDCIRRRGENISATDVELVVAGISGVSEVAAFAVPSDIPGGEDEVMLAVVPRPGAGLSPAELGARVEVMLPRFARPRFVEFMTELPKTATGKVQRAVLRKRGTATALDRDAP